ncbi:transcriptional regulator [Paenibacillaceae bacterium]|nr:transcriptional regulator [Paenibacillaceae bacterium]
MQFSKSTDYALHALIQLRLSERCHNVGIKELSGALGVSESYLSKIMSKLADVRMLEFEFATASMIFPQVCWNGTLRARPPFPFVIRISNSLKKMSPVFK